MGNIWGVIVGGGVPRLPQPGGAREHRLLAQREHPLRQPPPEPRRAAVRVGHLRGDHPRRHALPAGGPDPVAGGAQPSCTRACTTSRSTTSTHAGTVDDVTEPRADRATSSSRGRSQGVRRPRRRQRRQLHRAARQGRVADRPERRRQDDVLQHAHRRLQADGGHDHVPRRGRHRQAAARDHRARHRAHVPEHPPLPEHDGARERARRHAHAAAGEPLRLDPAHAGVQARGGERARSARSSCSSSPACAARRTRPRRTCRTATSGGSRSRARSPPSRSCCCSTSRPPA